jgi:hypothetical protein
MQRVREGVSEVTAGLEEGATREDHRSMVSPAVIAGFAAIDAAVFGQLIYGIRSYERHHDDDAAAPRRRD